METWQILVTVGVPSGIFGFAVWLIERKIEQHERKRTEEAKKRENIEAQREKSREELQKRKEEAEERRARREAMRVDYQVSGVSFNSTVGGKENEAEKAEEKESKTKHINFKKKK